MNGIITRTLAAITALVGGFFALLLIVFVVHIIGTYPWTILLLMAPVALGARAVIRRWLDHQEGQSEIAARADHQHNALMGGNTPEGMFGQYPPATTN